MLIITRDMFRTLFYRLAFEIYFLAEIVLGIKCADHLSNLNGE